MLAEFTKNTERSERQVTAYDTLQTRLQNGDLVLLDGAIGTQLQHMGVPMSNEAWAATALQTHPTTVRHMHEKYIRADVDVITANSYSRGAAQLGAAWDG